MKHINNFNLYLESKKDKFPNIQKLEIDGFLVYVGKDAKSNDYLTFNISDGDDLWMHVKGVPGSHVVIKTKEINSTKEISVPTKEVIKKAAELAKKNSKADKQGKSTVVYCKRKFVRKRQGMNDGQVEVDYTNSEEIKV
jgi:predicted ribosome quality control (RQC) complex YloA/Tae2 family protein